MYPRNIMKFYSPRRSTLRFAALVACVSITLGTLIATPQITGAATFGDVWREIVQVLSPGSPSRSAAGGKGSEPIVSPGIWVNDATKPAEVWNLRPVILYEASGNLNDVPNRVELRQDETIIQSFDLKDKPPYRRLSIDTTLEPGQKYEIVEFLDGSTTPKGAGIKFTVMSDGSKRQAIADHLTEVDQKFPDDQAKRSINRIQVFVDAKLWSDALQEASTLVETAKDWQILKAEIIEGWKEKERKAKAAARAKTEEKTKAEEKTKSAK
jgi:hypothetical protein